MTRSGGLGAYLGHHKPNKWIGNYHLLTLVTVPCSRSWILIPLIPPALLKFYILWSTSFLDFFSYRISPTSGSRHSVLYFCGTSTFRFHIYMVFDVRLSSKWIPAVISDGIFFPVADQCCSVHTSHRLYLFGQRVGARIAPMSWLLEVLSWWQSIHK